MILCCGEALIDMIPKPALDEQEGFVPHAGGAVFNTALALGRLSAPAGMLTGLSTDMFGTQLLTSLQDSHVDTSHIITSDRPTTLAFVKLQDGQASYSFFDENSAGRMIRPADLPAVSDNVTTLFFGGISLASDPGAQTYAALLKRESHEKVVMIDPNIRAGFIQDQTLYRKRLYAMMGQSDIVKVSDEDLNWVSPTPASLRDKAEALLHLGPALVIVTKGQDGAFGVTASGKEIEIPAHPAKVKDTVGAGDAFNAGVLAKLSELGCLKKDALRSASCDTLAQAMDYGARVASVAVSREGANPPWANEVTAAA